jgi:single-strand DNA-binding protein
MYKKQGTIIAIGAIKQVSDKFRNRTFAVKDDSNYPQSIQFELVQDRVDLIQPFQIGDKVEVNFVVNGREWTDPKIGEVRYFNSLVALSLSKVGESTYNSSESPQPSLKVENEDSLPF